MTESSKKVPRSPAYDEQEYWETRYNTQTDFFDWYLVPYERISRFMSEKLDDSQVNLLEVGCGNSKFCLDAFDSGLFESVTGVDYS